MNVADVSELTVDSIIFTYADSALERSRRRSVSTNIPNMSQDIVSDALNQMMNALKAKHTSVTLKRHSKLLLSVLAIAKLKGYVTSYTVDGNSLTIELGKLNGCNSIKPRFMIGVSDIGKYVARYLPAREIGILIISTNQGLVTHQTAQDKNLGGSLIAYMF